jgi:hypothetical protein
MVLAPIHVRIIIILINIQNINFFIGMNGLEIIFLDFKIGNINIKIERIKAITPPNLLGIHRKIA